MIGQMPGSRGGCPADHFLSSALGQRTMASARPHTVISDWIDGSQRHVMLAGTQMKLYVPSKLAAIASSQARTGGRQTEVVCRTRRDPATITTWLLGEDWTQFGAILHLPVKVDGNIASSWEPYSLIPIFRRGSIRPVPRTLGDTHEDPDVNLPRTRLASPKAIGRISRRSRHGSSSRQVLTVLEVNHEGHRTGVRD